ncbi:MAG TPA: M4 family metallopeptidase [Chitinispirillaceae bacterium]|nr:M4 family metallopeptidase [Chitinispirillaceae bacterium]
MSYKRSVVTGFLITVFLCTSSTYTMNATPRAANSTLKKQVAAPLRSDSLTIQYDSKQHLPIFISGKISENNTVSPTLKKADFAAYQKKCCHTFLSQISHVLKISNSEEELIVNQNDDAAGSSEITHYKICQRYRGMRVLGAEATIHLHNDHAEFIGHTVATPTVSLIPTISKEQAISFAVEDLKGAGVSFQEFSPEEKVYLDYDKPVCELIIAPSKENGAIDCIAYQVLIRPDMLDWWEYLINAHTGEVVLKYNRTCDAGDATANVRDLSGTQRLIHTYQTDRYYMIDASRPMFNSSKSQIPNKLTSAIVTYDYQNRYPATSSFNLISSTNNTWDPKAVSAQYNASVAYEYYRTTHGRNSIDGKGGSVLSFINVAEQNGAAMDNAYWNGRGMYYGNGSKVFNSLAAGLDVAGHELTHGVVEATAALRYVGQSGALNESFADIFGCMIERQNWKMGETVVKPGVYSSNAMRDLSNPHNGVTRGKQGWQPQSMQEYQNMPNTTAGDNGGVHVNNSIPNYAYYLFATAVGKEKAERVFYKTLTAYLSASSQFADLRIGARLACEELYGKETEETKALATAFDSVGVFDDTQPFDHVEDIPVNPGKEYVLLAAAPPASDGTTLYIADSAFGSLKGISKRKLEFRPSVSDDGKMVLFVSSDKKLIALTLNGTNATEKVIDSLHTWSRCAVSRDGLQYAAVREINDTSIYIGKMRGGNLQRFSLNGPANSSQGVSGAVMSTALEWNFKGDNVIYDVYNSLSGPNGTRLTNYDIGFLRGWDPDSNSFGDGEVSKLFNNLAEGISVGNPTFSKNSPNIIAYENIDDLTGSISVVTMNMENRKTVTIANVAFPGYPSYSKKDDKIAYSTINGNDTVVSVVKVKGDKQTVDGSSSIAIRKMKWAVYFAMGSRQLTPVYRKVMPVITAAGSKLGIEVLSSRSVVRTMICGADNTPVQISISRSDGKVVHRERMFIAGPKVPYNWNGKTANGNQLGTGVYFMRLQTPKTIAVKRITYFN